jgi:hypothetical protein
VRQYLVVANKTLRSEQLHQRLRDLAAQEESFFHLVVPATHPHGSWADGTVHADATRRVAEALERFADVAAGIDGEVVDDASPVRAVGDVLIREPGRFDAIVVSTLPPGPSRWLKFDVVNRLRSHGLPVIHVVEARQHTIA